MEFYQNEKAKKVQSYLKVYTFSTSAIGTKIAFIEKEGNIWNTSILSDTVLAEGQGMCFVIP